MTTMAMMTMMTMITNKYLRYIYIYHCVNDVKVKKVKNRSEIMINIAIQTYNHEHHQTLVIIEHVEKSLYRR